MNAESTAAMARLRRAFAGLALAAAALTFVVIVASAFMRHTQAGLSCADWPACYGRMAIGDGDAVPSTGVRLARIAHRLAATSVLALIVGMLLVAWTQRPAWKREGMLALAAFIVAAALAVLGLATPGARFPAVTLGNLLGGYLMLALLAATCAAARRTDIGSVQRAPRVAPSQWSTLAVLALVVVMATLGGTIGAQYALPACPTLSACPAFSWDEFVTAGALDPFRALVIDGGRVVPPAGAAALHVAHRALGIVVAIVVLVLAWRWHRTDPRAARMLVALALAAPILGVTAIAALPALWFTVLHNAAAASLVAVLTYLAAADSRP